MVTQGHKAEKLAPEADPTSPFQPQHNNNRHSGLRLLSLDGGGVKGLSSLIVLQRLMNMIDPASPPKPCHVFHMIGGTGTGGLIAIMLGRLEMTIDDCIGAYLCLSERLFSKSRHSLAPLDSMRLKFNAQELERVIKEIIEEGGENPDSLLKIKNGPQCAVFVCRRRVNDPSTVHFLNYSCDNRQDGMDGAAGFNNPVEEVWRFAKELWPAPDDVPFNDHVHCLVSIGTGRAKDQPLDRHSISPSIIVATETEQTAAKFEQVHISLKRSGKYFRFNVPNGLGDIGLEEYSKITQISGATSEFLDRDGHGELRVCAQSLTETRRRERPANNGGRRLNIPFTTMSFGMPSRSQLSKFIIPLLLTFWLFLDIAWIHPTFGTLFSLTKIDDAAPIIAIMGETGVGKSSFIETLGGQHISTGALPKIGRTLESETTKISWYKASINDRNVYLIDTPGFDDSRKQDYEILYRLSTQLADYYQSGRLLTGIIYLHDISKVRMGNVGKKQLGMFEQLLGTNAFPNCVLVTTKWDPDPSSEKGEEQQDREKELKDNYWKTMLDAGSIVTQHSGKLASARRIVTYLVDKPRIVLQHQHERVIEKKSFEKTLAGQTALGGLADPSIQDAFRKREALNRLEQNLVWVIVLIYLAVLYLFWYSKWHSVSGPEIENSSKGLG